MDVTLDLVVAVGLLARLVVRAGTMDVTLDLGLLARLVVRAGTMDVALDLFVLALLLRHCSSLWNPLRLILALSSL
jgi:hypothetical protein